MRRILSIALLAVMLLMVLSLPAFAGNTDTPKCSDPPNAWGKNTAMYAQWYQDQHGLPYGQTEVRYLAWGKWSPWFFDYKNHGDYVNQTKADL